MEIIYDSCHTKNKQSDMAIHGKCDDYNNIVSHCDVDVVAPEGKFPVVMKLKLTIKQTL